MQQPTPPPQQPNDYPYPPQPPAYPYGYPPQPPRRRKQSPLRGGCLGCCLGGVFFAGGIFVLFVLVLVIYALNPPPPTNILILGSDARPNEPAADAARTDTIMVLGVNGEKQKVSLFSLPRDVFIQAPNFGWLRSNTVVRNGELSEEGSGVALMITSMENTFGMDIDHYARVSFEGFVDVVDALGGVDIDVPKHIIDYEYPTEDYGTMVVEFNEGKQHMDGETALIYSRTRHADDDYQRASRQQQVLDAIFSKIRNPLYFYRLPGVLVAFNDNFNTDMTIGDLLSIAPGIILYGNNPDSIDRFVVDREHIYGGSSGEALPDIDTITPWIESHLE